MKRNLVSMCLLILCMTGFWQSLMQLWFSFPIAIGCFCCTPKFSRSCFRNTHLELLLPCPDIQLLMNREQMQPAYWNCKWELRNVSSTWSSSPLSIVCRLHQQISLQQLPCSLITSVFWKKGVLSFLRLGNSMEIVFRIACWLVGGFFCLNGMLTVEDSWCMTWSSWPKKWSNQAYLSLLAYFFYLLRCLGVRVQVSWSIRRFALVNIKV